MKTTGTKPVKIIPLGGLEQIGMNITAFEYEDSIIVVDCGLAFPDEEMLGIDLVIPDITYLKDIGEQLSSCVCIITELRIRIGMLRLCRI